MTETSAAGLEPEEIALVQERVMRVLTVGQMIGGGALASAVTVGGFVIQNILGQDTPWAGLATATMTTGTGLASQVLARRMRRRGRRDGMCIGYALATVGALACAVGAETKVLLAFLVGLVLFGAGQAANLLSRYAATDLAPEDHRGRAMSRVLFASTFGAVGGPLLIRPAQFLGEQLFGFDDYTGPWLLASLFFAGALANVAVRLRPDPLILAGGTTTERTPIPPFHRTLRYVGGIPAARLALASMVVSQAGMVAVMTMTPVHLKHYGHESVSALVVSVHVAGMFAFSPLVGRFCDRNGRHAAILVGGAILVTSTVIASLAGGDAMWYFPALWLLGIGWSFGLIGGSSLLVDAIPVTERANVQGTADLLMSACGGVAGLSSGFLRAAFGFHRLAELAALAALVLTVAALRAWRRAPLAAAALMT